MRKSTKSKKVNDPYRVARIKTQHSALGLLMAECEQLRRDLARCQAENARLAAACMAMRHVLTRSKHENLGHRCSDDWFIERDRVLMQTPPEALRDLLAPTIEFLSRLPCPEYYWSGTKVDGFGNPHQCQFCFEKNAELARLLAITKQ